MFSLKSLNICFLELSEDFVGTQKWVRIIQGKRVIEVLLYVFVKQYAPTVWLSLHKGIKPANVWNKFKRYNHAESVNHISRHYLKHFSRLSCWQDKVWRMNGRTDERRKSNMALWFLLKGGINTERGLSVMYHVTVHCLLPIPINTVEPQWFEPGWLVYHS